MDFETIVKGVSLSLLCLATFAHGQPSTRPSDDEAAMRRNAAEQAGALKQDPGGADRDKLLKDRLKERIDAGRPEVRSDHPDAQWFARGPMGLFLHWGIASVDGNADLSWPMIMNMGAGRKIKPRDYWALADRFKAENYDPNVWLKAAKAAGFEYVVLTTKHHDGYTLFPTDSTDLGVQTKLGGRDLVKEYVDACRANGLKVGFYYSGPDWWMDREYHDFNYRADTGKATGSNSSLPPIAGRKSLDIDWNEAVIPPVPRELTEKMRRASHQQLTELLTRYGKVDVLWFDGGTGCDITLEEIRRLQPGIVINNRGGMKTSPGGARWPGDYFTFEHGEPVERPPGWWEQLRIWNTPNWGYTKRNETAYTATPNILALLARTRANGGAILLNAGPRPDGTLPEPYYKGMAEVEAWMKVKGRSVIDTSPAPLGVVSNVPITVRGNQWYLHVVAGSKGAVKVTPGSAVTEIVSAKLLDGDRDGASVPFEWADGVLTLQLPVDPGAAHQVVVVETRSK